MVARSEEPASITPGLKPTKKAAKLPVGRGVAYPLATRLKVRNLYLGQALNNQDIAERTGLTARQVGQMVYRDGLAKQKRRRAEKINAAADTRANAQLEAFNEQLAEEAEEISLGALERARQSVESVGEFAAKDFQSWTGGIRNLVQAARTVRGLDNRNGQSDTNQVSIYLVRGETLEHTIKNVTPNLGQLPA